MADVPTFIAERFRSGLTTLLTAFDYAAESNLDTWQLAVALPDLLAQGATLVDIRWLLLRGFAEHAMETTAPSDPARSFRRLPPAFLDGNVQVVLSQQGADALRAMISSHCSVASSESSAPLAAGPPTELPTAPRCEVPVWDVVRRELRYRDQVVTRYRVPAHNQELILAAFQEEGWPEFIDDPLPPEGEYDPKRRLQATIKSLNRNRHAALIRFHGNGMGSAVCWRAVEPSRRAER